MKAFYITVKGVEMPLFYVPETEEERKQLEVN